MQHKNIVIAVVSLTVLAIAATTAISWFVTASNESRAYDLACPAMYVNQSDCVAIGIIKDWRDTARLGDAFAPVWKQLPGSITKTIRPSDNHPALAVRYRNGSIAFWCAARPKAVQQLIAVLSLEVSNGYEAIRESLPNGADLYHFTTADNRFIYLYHNQSVIGYSDESQLLVSPTYDTNLAQTVDKGAASAMPTIVYGDSVYCIYHIKQNDSSFSYQCKLHTVPPYLSEKNNFFLSDAIPATACNALQATCVTIPFIAATVSRVFLADNPNSSAVFVAHVTDHRALGKALRPYLTPYGYRMPADSLARFIPAAWIEDDMYWIEVRGTTLLASVEARALQQYAQALRRPQRFMPPLSLPPAILTYISIGDSLPRDEGAYMPSLELPFFIADTSTCAVQIVAIEQQHYEKRIIVPSYNRNRHAANR